MTQNAKTTILEEILRDWNSGKSTSKTRLWHWTRIQSAWRVRARVYGLWPRGLRHDSRDVGRAFVGLCWALFGSVGQCAAAHSLHALERSREVWTAR